ncbi:hypothetical protein MY3957_008105 [Beauveria namnaoensis]
MATNRRLVISLGVGQAILRNPLFEGHRV